jgi:hypothetical protein
MTTRDPLLQPFRLKHLTLKNRIMSTEQEPSSVFSLGLPYLPLPASRPDHLLQADRKISSMDPGGEWDAYFDPSSDSGLNAPYFVRPESPAIRKEAST